MIPWLRSWGAWITAMISAGPNILPSWCRGLGSDQPVVRRSDTCDDRSRNYRQARLQIGQDLMPIFNGGIERIVAHTNGSWQSIIPTSTKTAWTTGDSEERRIRPIAWLRKITGSHA
jgi:hypothetical protein